MKTLNYRLLVSALLVFTQPLTAQWAWGTKADYESMKKRELIVMTIEPDAKEMEYLRKKGKTELLEQLEEIVNTANENLKMAVEQHWIYHESAEFKTVSEIEALKKTKTHEYVVIYTMSVSSNSTTNFIAPLFYEYFPTGNEFNVAKKSDALEGSLFRVELIENFNEGSMYMIGVGMGKRIPDEADFTFAIEFSQILAEGFLSNSKSRGIKSQIRDNGAQLKNLKLAIRAEDLDSDLTSPDIDETYNGAFEIVSDERYNEIINNREVGYAYIMLNAGPMGTQFPVVMNAETGAILAFATAGYSIEKEPALSNRQFAFLSKIIDG